MVLKYKSFEDIDFETLLKILQDDTILEKTDLQSAFYVYAIRNLFEQIYDSIKNDKYKITFQQLYYVILANMKAQDGELYKVLNLIYHNDFDDLIEDKPTAGITLLARLTHFNKYVVELFNDFSRTIAKYRLPDNERVYTNRRGESDFVYDIIYIACKGDVSKLPVVDKLNAEDVLMFIEQESRKTYEIKKQSRL